MLSLKQKFEIWAKRRNREKTDILAVAKFYLDNSQEYKQIHDLELLVDADGAGCKHRLVRNHGFVFQINPENHKEFKLVDIVLDHKPKVYPKRSKNVKTTVGYRYPEALSGAWCDALGMTWHLDGKEKGQ